MENDTRRWMDDLQVRLNRSNNVLRREQALLELMMKITDLMKTGNFKEAAYLRSCFEQIKATSEASEEI